MATLTSAQRKSLEAKALKAGSKSAGMRDLLDAGYEVKEVAAAFGAPYGFAYGVAVRHAASTNGTVAATRRAPAKTATAKAASTPTRGRGRPPKTGAAAAARSPEAARSAARRIAGKAQRAKKA